MLRTLIVFLTVLAAVVPVRAEVSIDRLIEDAGLKEGPVASRDLARWRPPQRSSPVSPAENEGWAIASRCSQFCQMSMPSSTARTTPEKPHSRHGSLPFNLGSRPPLASCKSAHRRALRIGSRALRN